MKNIGKLFFFCKYECSYKILYKNNSHCQHTLLFPIFFFWYGSMIFFYRYQNQIEFEKTIVVVWSKIKTNHQETSQSHHNFLQTLKISLKTWLKVFATSRIQQQSIRKIHQRPWCTISKELSETSSKYHDKKHKTFYINTNQY